MRMTDSKLLTIAVPAYNSGSFMHKCLDTLVHSGTDVEVLVINDGSPDDTLAVAKRYEEKYPDVIVAVDQENRNWGGAINHAMELARGKYFYIVDSDDWLDVDAFGGVMAKLRMLESDNTPVDLFVVNYVYNRVALGDRHTIQYRSLIPADRVVVWDDLSVPKIDQYLMIHSMIYRTDVIRQSGLKLPEGESYMDSLVMLKPLRYVKTLFYHDCDLYWYTIGREGQSIDGGQVAKHVDEQIHATQVAIDGFDYQKLQEISPRLASCSLRYLSAMMTVSSITLYRIGTPEAYQLNDELWEYLKNSDSMLYLRLHASLAGLVYKRTDFGRKLALLGYDVAARIFKFA